jgi:hypothetical protein
MTILDASEAVIIQLKKFIEDNVEQINKVYEEWPSHSQELDMPCCAVRTVGTPQFRHDPPQLLSHENGLSKYTVGTYDMTINIDIWADSKQKRGDITQLLFDLFNKQFMDNGHALGISLNLEDYHNIIARYDLDGYNYNDSEEASQRNEYRTILSVLSTFSRVQEKEESTIQEIAVTHSISDEDIDNPDIEEVYTID